MVLPVGSELVQIHEPRLARGRILRNSLADSQDVLASLAVDADSDQQDVVVDVDPVDHQDRQAGLRRAPAAHGPSMGASTAAVARPDSS
jgi:hypothetical protein